MFLMAFGIQEMAVGRIMVDTGSETVPGQIFAVQGSFTNIAKFLHGESKYIYGIFQHPTT